MNVFGLRDEVITEYGEFVGSFIQVRAEDLAAKVKDHFASERLWPQPMLQLNPAFEPGADIDELVDEGVLHEKCREIFRLRKSEEDPGRPLRLHRHQEEALRAAKPGGHYVHGLRQEPCLYYSHRRSGTAPRKRSRYPSGGRVSDERPRQQSEG